MTAFAMAGKMRAEPVLAVQALGDEGDGRLDRAGAPPPREQRLGAAQRPVDREEEAAPSPSRSGCEVAPLRSGGVTNSSAIPIRRGFRACGLSAIRTASGTITVRDQ